MVQLLKNKGLLILIIFLVSSVSGSCILFKMYRSEKKERQRVEFNQDALLQKEQERYTAIINGKDSINVLSTSQLRLTKREAKENRDSLVGIIKDLHIRLNRVQSVTTSTTSVDVNFDAPIVDRPVLITKHDTTYIDTMKCIEYKDAYNLFSGCIDGDTLRNARIKTVIPLTQVIHRVPKFEIFGFIKIGTKGIKQEMFCDNPHATIEYSESISFK
jgi:Family of unknown function (DUF6549)